MPEIELRAAIPELERAPSEQDYGADLETGSYAAWIGENPVAWPYLAMFEAAKKPVPSVGELANLYDLWLIPHSVNIIRRSGMAEVTNVGIECEYLTGNSTCSVVGLMPTPQFVTYGSVGVQFGCKLSPLGAMEGLVPSESEGDIDFHGFKVSGSVDVNLGVTLSVSTPYISAVGLGSRRAEWNLSKYRDPLFGRSIQTWTILLLSKFQIDLIYKLRYSMTLRTAFIPKRYQSDWQEIRCQLVRNASAACGA